MFTRRDAATVYDTETDAIHALLDQLRDRLEDHSRDFAQSGSRDWGYPGDLGHIRELLQEANDFLSHEIKE